MMAEEQPKEAAPEETLVKEIAKADETKVEPRRVGRDWSPKTDLGKRVFEGKISDMSEIFSSGDKILEAEIVDRLIPSIENELILIGGSPGKGGGIKRTPAKRTSRMHKSGRRYKTSSLVVVGNRDGYVGIGLGRGTELRSAINKAVEHAKKAILPVRRGCGSWECKCGNPHSIPVEVTGKHGSVRVKLIPAPKGIGLVANEEAKKILQLAGVQDIWCKSFGQTQTTINFTLAIIDAFKVLNKMKMQRE